MEDGALDLDAAGETAADFIGVKDTALDFEAAEEK